MQLEFLVESSLQESVESRQHSSHWETDGLHRRNRHQQESAEPHNMPERYNESTFKKCHKDLFHGN